MVQEALEVVQKRVSELILCSLVSPLRYLNGTKNLRVPDDEFQMASRKTIIRSAKSLLSRFKQTQEKT